MIKDIFYKYGLFIHQTISNKPLDYVWAIYPSETDTSLIAYEREEYFDKEIKPSLGNFSIPIKKEKGEDFKNFILALTSDYKSEI